MYELTQIQDIAGCRAILHKLSFVYEIQKLLPKELPNYQLIATDDYIQNPRESGYRGIHLIFKYIGPDVILKNLRVEVQLRTYVQHTWATGVEIVDLFKKQNLKAGNGDKDWLKFFYLLSLFIEYKELNKLPVEYSTIDFLKADINNFNSIIDAFGFFKFLPLHVKILNAISKDNEKIYHFLIKFEPEAIEVLGFEKDQYQLALKEFYAIEYKLLGTNNSVVLISVSSVHELINVYPNYFGNVSPFNLLLFEAITPNWID